MANNITCLQLLVLLTAFSLTGCLNNVEDVSSSRDYDPSEISYSSDIQPIFTSSCGGAGCHISSTTNGVNLSSYDAVMNSVGQVYGTPIVIPGEPDNSPLVDKIEPNPEIGNRMPQTGSFLTQDEINKIRAWIEGGAENN